MRALLARGVVVAIAATLILGGPVAADILGTPGDDESGGTHVSTAQQLSPEQAPSSRGLNTRTFTTGESPLQPDSPNQGWWGTTPNNSANDNYIVGHIGDGGLHRNFFTFDISSLHRRVVWARLDIYSADLQGNPTERLGLFDVSTTAKPLNANTGRNRNIYRDLGSGRSYGYFDVNTLNDDQWLSFRLNRAAERNIDETTRRYFSIGGRLLSVGSPDDAPEYLFGNSHLRDLTIRLVVRTVPRGPR